jgi:hypothetical protein
MTILRLHFLISIVVEFAKESRPRRDVYEGDRNHGYDAMH